MTRSQSGRATTAGRETRQRSPSARRPKTRTDPRELDEQVGNALDVLFAQEAKDANERQVDFPTIFLEKAFPGKGIAMYSAMLKRGHVCVDEKITGQKGRKGNRVTIFREPQVQLIRQRQWKSRKPAPERTRRVARPTDAAKDVTMRSMRTPHEPLPEKMQEALAFLLEHGRKVPGGAVVQFPTTVLRQRFPATDAIRCYAGLQGRGYLKKGKRVQGKANKWGFEVTVFRTPHPSRVSVHRRVKTAKPRAVVGPSEPRGTASLLHHTRPIAKHAAKAAVVVPQTQAAMQHAGRAADALVRSVARPKHGVRVASGMTIKGVLKMLARAKELERAAQQAVAESEETLGRLGLEVIRYDGVTPLIKLKK